MSDETTANLFADFNILASREGLLPVRVTSRFRRLIQEEVAAIGIASGPLWKIAYPTPARITNRAPYEVPDFVQDKDNMHDGLKGVAVRKYNNRILFFPTDVCSGHCMYCFRQDLISEAAFNRKDGNTPLALPARLATLVDYTRRHPSIEEVILSGGDPLSLPVASLKTILSAIAIQLPQVKHIRVHSRNLIYAPQRYTEEVCELFGHHKVRVVHHVVHPYELNNDTIAVANRFALHRVRQYAQFPLLQGINDHPKVLELLLNMLDDHGIRPLSIFIADPIKYSATFRLPLTTAFAIVDEVNRTAPAWVNSVRLVLDTPHGKVRREHIHTWDKTGDITFELNGHAIRYRDLPVELYQPIPIATMLWRG